MCYMPVSRERVILDRVYLVGVIPIARIDPRNRKVRICGIATQTVGGAT